MAVDSNNYELAYLLTPSTLEAEVLTYVGKLTTLIEESKGMIRHIQEPRKRLLGYPVKKQKSAYFGWTTFAMAPENLSAFKKKVKTVENIIRYMIVEEEAEMRPDILRTFPTRSAKPRPIPREMPKPDEKLDLEALDKKLEEILGK